MTCNVYHRFGYHKGYHKFNTKRKIPPEKCPRRTPTPREQPPRKKATLQET